MSSTASLARRVGSGDAVVVGLGSMIGAGVFAAFAPAARAAGAWLLLALAIAGGVAYCNAVASAQLAAQYPTSGGTYVYGRERLGDWWGFAAGWAFVVGKTASCAAMALTFASYATAGPRWLERLVAAAAVIALTATNYRGITRTLAVARVLVALSVAALLVFLVAIAATGRHELGFGSSSLSGYGVLQAAGFLFFAFAGYARIATLGEEVRDPARTIPRAIPIALAIAFALYLAVGVAALAGAGPDALAATTRPLSTALDAAGAAWALPAVRIGAAIASLGSLLALIAGVGRTTLAMARNGDMPRRLASVHPSYRVPDQAEILIGAAVVVLVLTTDLRHAIGFSSFGVLLYYAIANVSAYTQARDLRRWPRVLNVAGLAGCLVLVAALPWTSVVAGTCVIAAGLLGRVLVGRAAPAT